MVQFRVIRVTSVGSIEAWCMIPLSEAYRACMEENQKDWHVKVFTEIERELTQPLPPLSACLVSYNQPLNAEADYVYCAYYIQALPELTPSIYVQFPTNIVKPGPIPC